MTEKFQIRDGVLHGEDVPLNELVREWGTPLYVYSRTAIRERYLALRDALAPIPHLIAYSVKANGNLAVLRTLAEIGGGADVVSGGELHRARLAGIPGDRIVFSGVGKTLYEMAEALRCGIYGFNVESEDELYSLSHLATASGQTARVALRVNPDVHSPTPHEYTRTGHAATKFGIPIADAPRLYRLAGELPGLHVAGVDFHIGSQILNVEPYRKALQQVLALADDLRADGHQLEFIDIGGGLGIAYEDQEGISAEDFAGAILPLMEHSGLRLVIEPGRFIVGAAGVLLARVVYVKTGGGRCFVITDAGMNDLLRPSHYSGFHRIDPVEPKGRRTIHADVVGPICETGDFIALDREMELPEPGELLAIRTVGAYGFSMSSTYNQRPRPAEVMVEGSEAKLVRRRETVDDLIEMELGLGDE